MSNFTITPIIAETLTPFHYGSVPIQDGVATIPDYIGDRAMSFAIANALGCMNVSPAMPKKDYQKHMKCLPWLSSLFKTDDPSLMNPLGCRLNIDAELGFHKKIQTATGTGNLKTWYFIQEVPVNKIYTGIVVGLDPFELVSNEKDSKIDQITVRIGRHRGGIVSLKKATKEEVGKVQLNAHTATIFDKKIDDSDIKMIKYAMDDMQVSEDLSIDDAADEIRRWNPDL